MISQRCVYAIGTDKEIKKYKFGGNPEGTVEIYDDRLEFFKKSKGVALAFGAIGSAIEGKGKPDFTVRLDQMRAWRPGTSYYIDLTDGNVLYVTFGSLGGKKPAAVELEALLAKIGTGAAASAPQPEPEPVVRAPEQEPVRPEPEPVVRAPEPEPVRPAPEPVRSEPAAPAPFFDASPSLETPAPVRAPEPVIEPEPVRPAPVVEPEPAAPQQMGATLQAAPSLEATVLPHYDPEPVETPAVQEPAPVETPAVPVVSAPAVPAAPASAAPSGGGRMGFGEALKRCFTQYATFSGRARRSEYWYFFLLNMLVSLLGGALLPPLAGIYALAVIIPTIAVGVRRLHDIGKPGVYYLVGLIPMIGTILLIVWMCQEGQSGDNEYGPDPKAEI